MFIKHTAHKLILFLFILMLFFGLSKIHAETATIDLESKSTVQKSSSLVITHVNQAAASEVTINLKATASSKSVLGNTSLVFTVTPDANGNWTYTIPEGLDPGTYEVTVKDQSGKVLETSTFTITSKKAALPDTGILDEIVLPVLGAIAAIFVGLFIFKFSRNKNIIK